MRIILLGPPGSGKGTQGDMISAKYGLSRISTGDLLRQAVRDKTALGKEAEAMMRRGGLVSDAIVEGLVRERIARPDCRRGYILDGFPRNLHQAQALEAIDGERPEIVIGIEVPPPVLVKRLGQRWTCSDCQSVYNLNVQTPKESGRCDSCGARLTQRDDDRPDVVQERIKVYHEQTEKLIRRYRRKGVYRAVNGDGAPEAIFREIAEILDRARFETKEAPARR